MALLRFLMKIFEPYLKKILNTFICIFLLVQINKTYAQGADKITESLRTYNESAIKEKLYVHTDKDFYLAGEIIWFKVYCTDAAFHKPLDVSKVAYIEILDNTNKPLLQAKVALNNAEGEGSFYLQQNIASGNFKLRAYTSWMKNFDADWFFEKSITIVDLKKLPDAVVQKPPKQFSIQFFPEGGNLVNGIESKMAFKAVTNESSSYSFNGYLLDNTDTLLKFKPGHSGMGHFQFTPATGHNYKAYIKPEDGIAFYKELPAAYNEGYVLGVKEAENGKINSVITANVASANHVYLVVHTRSLVKIASELTLQNGKTEFSFDDTLLDDGISTITVFNDNRQPVCERLYFKYPANNLDLNIATAQPIYDKRKEVVLNVNSARLSGDENASLSMSVYKLDSLQKINKENIQTYLLLTSDIKGDVEDAAYYFSANNKNIAGATDDLMLTQGWRRFDWGTILKNLILNLHLRQEAILLQAK